MSSILRIQASRANGAKSRGPITPEGKAKSAANSVRSTGPRTPAGKARASLNAVRHGLLSRLFIEPNIIDILRRYEVRLSHESSAASTTSVSAQKSENYQTE